jgi:hypothetical protein
LELKDVISESKFNELKVSKPGKSENLNASIWGRKEEHEFSYQVSKIEAI